jgi:hypothetical protein
LYVISTDTARDSFERKVVNFNADQKALYLEWPADTDEIVTSDDYFELLEMWPAHEIHDAINDVIRDSWRVFPEVLTDETVVIQEDVREYDISTLSSSRSPADIQKIWIEQNTTARQGQVSSGHTPTTTVFGDTTMDLSDLTASTTASSDWRMGFYNGTGKGQLFEIASASTTTQLLTVSVAATTTPDTTTFYTLWNQNDQNENWYPIVRAEFDRLEYPTYMRIFGNPTASWGQRFRIQYIPEYNALSADSDTTTLPEYYIKNKTLAFLHDDLAEDNRADRRGHMELAETKDRLARDFAGRHPRRWPSGTIWSEANYGRDGYTENPMGWD